MFSSSSQARDGRILQKRTTKRLWLEHRWGVGQGPSNAFVNICVTEKESTVYCELCKVNLSMWNGLSSYRGAFVAISLLIPINGVHLWV